MAEYIQILEFQTSDIDAVRSAVRERTYDDAPQPISVVSVADRDRPGIYASILRFASYEEAMKHSEAESTHALIEKLAPLMTGEQRFYNFDVVEDMVS